MARSSHRLAWVADGFLECFTLFISKVKRISLPFLRPLPHRFLVRLCLLLYRPQTKISPKKRLLRWLREERNHKLCNFSFFKRKENGKVRKISKRSLSLRIGSRADSLKSCYFFLFSGQRHHRRRISKRSILPYDNKRGISILAYF